MKKIFLLIVLMNVFSVLVCAQIKDSLSSYFSLQQAIEFAYQHQKDVLNADLDVQIAKAKVKETRGMGLPQVAASFDVKDYIELNYLFPDIFAGGEPGAFVGLPIQTPSYSATAGVQATQLLFDGSYLVGLKASKTYREFSHKNLTRTKIDLVVAVSKAYYSVLVNRKRLSLVFANVTRLKKLNDDTKAMYDNGFVEKIDLDRVLLTYNNINTEKEKAERLIALSEYYLKFQMGIDIHEKILLTDSLNVENIRNVGMLSEKNDVTNRIEYSLLQTQQRLLELDLKKNRAQYYPSIVLYGNLYTTEQRPTFDPFNREKKWYPTGFVGATFSLPIFSGLQKHYRVDQAKLSIRKLKNEIDYASNVLDLETISSKTALTNAVASLNTQEKNLELANEVYRVSKLKYDQGVGSNLEVINAETSLKEAQINYYNAMYEALVAKIDLDKSLGLIK